MRWEGAIAAWWRREVETDPAYARDVDPLFRALLPEWSGFVVDIGCGDGRLLSPGRNTVGVDPSFELVAVAAASGPACVAAAEHLPFASGAASGAYAVLVLEHLETTQGFFTEAARIVEPGGFLVVVLNHPVYTAPGSAPVVDPTDDEVLWRWGSYLAEGFTDEPAGKGAARFHHRPLGMLLEAAAHGGWCLDGLQERPLDPAGDPLLMGQRQVPRLLGARWRLLQPAGAGR